MIILMSKVSIFFGYSEGHFITQLILLTNMKKILNSIMKYGLLSTTKKLFSYIKNNYVYHFDDKVFDLIHRVDTTGKEDSFTLSVPDSYKNKVVPYEAMKSKNFYLVMNSLNIEWSNYSFIDVGSGKGKVLLLASKYPFQRIIGVELSRTLVEKAKENISNFRPKSSFLKRITLINKDIIDYNPTKENVIFFLYNPFNAEIMTSFVKKIELLVKSQKNRIIIIYFNPVHVEMFRGSDHFQPTMITDKYAIFSSLD